MQRLLLLLLACAGIALGQYTPPPATSATPSGPCGGDLGGTYPNCTVTGQHFTVPLAASAGGDGVNNGTFTTTLLANFAPTINGGAFLGAADGAASQTALTTKLGVTPVYGGGAVTSNCVPYGVSGGTVTCATADPLTTTDGCPELSDLNQVCPLIPPYYASGSGVTTTTSGTTAPGTSVTLASVSTFSTNQGIWITGAGPVNVAGGTFAYASGGTATGTGFCIASASNGGGGFARASVSVSAGTISGNLTLISGGRSFASPPTTWTLALPANLASPSTPAALTCSGTITTTGGALVASNYVGTITAINGSVLTISPATTTSVPTATLVQHDDTAALRAVIAVIAASSTPSMKMILPSGTYRVSTEGGFTTSSSINSILAVPEVSYLDGWPGTAITGNLAVVDIEGIPPSAPCYNYLSATAAPCVSGAIIKTDSTFGSVIGGGHSAGYSGFTGVLLSLKGLTFRTYHNPAISAINAAHIANLKVDNITVDVGQTGLPGDPTTGQSYGLQAPLTGNGATVNLGQITVTGYAVGASISEWAEVGNLQLVENVSCLLVPGNTHPTLIHFLLTQACAYHVVGSGAASKITIQSHGTEDAYMSLPSWAVTQDNYYDPSNFLIGSDATDGGVVRSGATKLSVSLLGAFPQVYANATLSNMLLSPLARTAGVTGQFNATVGGLNVLTSGNNNWGGGINSLFALTTGTKNTGSGQATCDTIITGSQNSCFGQGSDVNSSSAAFRTVIGASAVGTADNTVTLGRSADTVVIPGATTATGVVTFTAAPRFNGGNTTAAVVGLIGTTCPAVTCTAAFTWMTVTTSDGSTGYIPIWK